MAWLILQDLLKPLHGTGDATDCILSAIDYRVHFLTVAVVATVNAHNNSVTRGTIVQECNKVKSTCVPTDRKRDREKERERDNDREKASDEKMNSKREEEGMRKIGEHVK